MPQITVDYSANLSDSFDRRGFASALHALTAEVAAATVANCKTRFRCLDEVYVADGAPGAALVHVQLGLLPGRTEAVKAELSEAVLGLLRKHLSTGANGTSGTSGTNGTNGAGLVVHTSVDVSELGPAYRKLVQ